MSCELALVRVAFHGDDERKTSLLNRARQRREEGKVWQGIDDDSGVRRRSMGCVLGTLGIKRVSTVVGVPRDLADLEDTIFEGLPNQHAVMWPERFINALQPGAFLGHVITDFWMWLLTDPVRGVLRVSKGPTRELIAALIPMLVAREPATSHRRKEFTEIVIKAYFKEFEARSTRDPDAADNFDRACADNLLALDVLWHAAGDNNIDWAVRVNVASLYPNSRGFYCACADKLETLLKNAAPTC